MYTYKFLRHANFEDVSIFVILFLQPLEDSQILCSFLCTHDICFANEIEDENFVNGKLTAKILKITSLENLYVYGSILCMHVCMISNFQ